MTAALKLHPLWDTPKGRFKPTAPVGFSSGEVKLRSLRKLAHSKMEVMEVSPEPIRPSSELEDALQSFEQAQSALRAAHSRLVRAIENASSEAEPSSLLPEARARAGWSLPSATMHRSSPHLGLENVLKEAEHLLAYREAAPRASRDDVMSARELFIELVGQVEGREFSKDENVAIGLRLAALAREAGYAVRCTKDGCQAGPGILRFELVPRAPLGGYFFVRHPTERRSHSLKLASIPKTGFRELLVDNTSDLNDEDSTGRSED